jgi:integrase
MARQQKQRNHGKGKTILRLPDLEQSRSAVLNSLAAASSQESYGHAIDEFTGWYCSEPRLAFNRTVVLRYRFFVEQKQLAPSTINVRLAAVRRLAYEAADAGLLSPELAAGIDRLAPHDLRRSCAKFCHMAGGELEQIQFLLGHVSIQTTEQYLGCKQKLRNAVNDNLGFEDRVS